MTHRRLHLLALWMSVLGSVFASQVVAEDTVEFISGSDGVRTTLRGQIVDIAGQSLRIDTGGSKERVIPLSRVQQIATTYSARQQAADALLKKHDFRGAVDQYRAALQGDHENRDWVRRQIVSQMVLCYRNLNMVEQAGEYFLILLSGDPATPYFDTIPLAWRGGEPTPAVEQKAKTWLARSDSAAAQLMAASHLLSTAENPRMVQRLRRLASDRDERIAWLAEAQLWRTEAFAADDATCLKWQRAIEESPADLRAGPYFVMAEAWKKRRPETAAATFLRLPILYPRERALCAAALAEAAACLDTAEKPREAAGLLVELKRDFAEQPEARAVRQSTSTGQQVAP
jgi:hypothetical protein